jgi:hypothetical protein
MFRAYARIQATKKQTRVDRRLFLWIRNVDSVHVLCFYGQFSKLHAVNLPSYKSCAVEFMGQHLLQANLRWNGSVSEESLDSECNECSYINQKAVLTLRSYFVHGPSCACVSIDFIRAVLCISYTRHMHMHAHPYSPSSWLHKKNRFQDQRSASK